MQYFLLYSITIQSILACFEAESNLSPRSVVAIETKVWTDSYCRVMCNARTDCLAMQYSATKKECYLLGPDVGGTRCGQPKANFVKQGTGCGQTFPRPVGQYVSLGCQDADDVKEIIEGLLTPCGTDSTPAGKLPYVLDVVRQDGSRDFYPNGRSSITWNTDLFAYFLENVDFKQYVTYARCVRAPGNPGSGCSCPSLTPPSIGPQGTQIIVGQLQVNKQLTCDVGFNLWVLATYERSVAEQQPRIVPSNNVVYCGFGRWFLWDKATDQVSLLEKADCLR